ncbi:glycosyl hydrolase 53 family protein [Teredinibacter purpureus]|uniref:glycosyl hydrolase 53 family protein n=1 Tax=Teredinibacter purpureus TaxID=2731756 RepID=UPI0013C4AC6E|nr:glycosyl hydrolase 53 family protein [Teredinibacter purpureus]
MSQVEAVDHARVALHRQGDFILGADISSASEFIDNGIVFVDTDGQEKPLLALLANHGFNYIRLRTFVEPSNAYGYASSQGQWCKGKRKSYNDKAHIVDFAQQVKAAGMKLLLDFHYSDTWADPNKQVIPEQWRHITRAQDMADEITAYTQDVMQALADADALPDMVQVGNEVTPGMLIHLPTSKTDCFGNNSVQNDALNGSIAHWDNLALYLNAGIAAVKHVHSDAQIMLHIENTGHPESVMEWVDNALARNVKFDVLGLSAYEQWQGPSARWRDTLNHLSHRYEGLKFSFVEYNPQRRLVNDIMRELPNGQGVGTFFWEPALSGEWGEMMFRVKGKRYIAKARDFAVYDQLVVDYGLQKVTQ